MQNSLIILCFLSLAWVKLISGRSVDQDAPVLTDVEKLSRLEFLEKQNSEYKERLSEYEKSDCQMFKNSTNIYIVYLPGIEPFAAPCESRIEDGGWTVIQRRIEGNINFQRSWNEYREGFGDLKGDFFIGLEKLHRMTTAHPQELLIFYEATLLKTEQEKFTNFVIGSEKEEYALKSAVDYSYNGLIRHIGEKFTTYDRDNDGYWLDNCAKIFNGGWWYGECVPDNDGSSNLNGPYASDTDKKARGIMYKGIRNIRAVQMMIRPQAKTEET